MTTAPSPEGLAIVFSRQEEIGGGTYLLSPGGDCVAKGLILPDQAKVLGNRMVFPNSPTEGQEIYVKAVGLNQPTALRLTSSPGKNESPEWSPDGSRIVFVSTRDGKEQLYVIDVDGRSERRLTTNAAADTDPAWSPDGSRIVFVSTRDGNRELYVMSPQGGGRAAAHQERGP